MLFPGRTCHKGLEGAKVIAKLMLSVDERGITQLADKAGVSDSNGCDPTVRE
jgi:hypothetical protein